MQKIGLSPRIEYLDGLRGIAALIVVLGHYTSAFLPMLMAQDAWPKWIGPLFPTVFNGRFSVYIFFVLSGFVLAQSSAKAKRGLMVTVIARYFRLTVPMLTALILAWFLVDRFHDARVAFQQIAHNPWLIDKFYTDQRPVFMTAVKEGVYQVYLTGSSLLDGPVWTMRNELAGSIAVYLLYIFWPTRFLLWGLALMTIVTLFGQNYLGFPLGIFLREAWVRGWIRSGLYGWVVLLISVLFEMATTFWSFGSPNALALAAAGVVFSVMTWPILQKIFDSPIPQFLGRISFALYLVHLPLVLSLAAWCYLNLNRPLNALFFLGIPALVACACGLAWLVTVLVDEPLVRLLHRLKRHGSRAFSNQGTDLRRS